MPRISSAIRTVVLLSLLAACMASTAWAREGDQRFTLFVGNTRFIAGGDTTYGGAFGFTYGYEFQDNLLWDFGATFASTNGEATDDAGNKYDISATTNEYRTGLTAFLGLSRNVVPFAGGGLSVLSYDIDYSYPGSDVGKTSGTSPGLYGLIGVELRVTVNFTVIPQFGVQVHRIQTEAGQDETLYSTGFLVSLRISN